MDLKKLGKALLFPHIAMMILLVPIATVLLVGSMVFVGTESVIAYISYVIAAYTLTVWCFKIPHLVNLLRTFKNENKYAIRWREDTRLRIKVSLYCALLFNTMYGIFHIWLGFYHRTFWFYALGAYYLSLGVMRFFLLLHTRRHEPGEKMQNELQKYRVCGWIFLIMNLALSIMVFFMVRFNRTFEHHMIVVIAMAAYTFTAFTVAIVNVVKYRKYNSPVFSASKAISLAAALVSMLTLESAMFTAFGAETMTQTQQKWMLGATGAAISVLIVATAIYMITVGTDKLKKITSEVEN